MKVYSQKNERKTPKPLFETGNLVMTVGVMEMVESGLNIAHYLMRHITGDWGDLCPEDIHENEVSLEHGFRILSAYETPLGKLWIITEADRSATTFLLPSEY